MATCSLDDLKAADSIIFGSPTYYQSVPKDVRQYIKALPKTILSDKWIVSFDTSLLMWKPIMLLTAAHGVMSRLRKLGGRKLVKPETFIVRNTETPSEGEIDLLDDGEMERAQSWARKIEQQLVDRGL